MHYHFEVGILWNEQLDFQNVISFSALIAKVRNLGCDLHILLEYRCGYRVKMVDVDVFERYSARHFVSFLRGQLRDKDLSIRGILMLLERHENGTKDDSS
jgi:hypothetical protein